MATNGNFMPQEQYNASQAAINSAGNAAGSNSDAPKDAEVGWFFVEQYYTTLSKSPEKLHVSIALLFARKQTNLVQLFYNKRSQFVSGIETEVANVFVGRQVSLAFWVETNFR